jgi:hypothetical protein
MNWRGSTETNLLVRAISCPRRCFLASAELSIESLESLLSRDDLCPNIELQVVRVIDYYLEERSKEVRHAVKPIQ